MIKLERVSKTFVSKNKEVQALKEVSLEVKKGEIFGVIGYSGAGKSTLIRCVNLLERPTSGKVWVDGTELTALSSAKLRDVRKKIGMIFQGFNLLKTATVYENIAIPLKLAGLPSSEVERRVKEYVSVVGLDDKLEHYPSQLSGGQKQRVAIARALAHEPEVLLSDEATSALDPETTDSILELLLKINRQFNITILLITHEMHVIQKVCDRVAVMENGQVIEEGRVFEIFTHPQHSITKKFVNSLFNEEVPEAVVDRLQATGPIITLSFVGESAGDPALAEVSKRFDVYPNILSGQITQLKDKPFGRLVVHLKGDESQTQQAIQYLLSRGIKVEGTVLDAGKEVAVNG
ncbi:D-methionine transport system ATP-binding protein [Caldalkalibacillus uzonensis]|uniref:D-methionine transport system ATP-binding protein n=1 Tax=Caldalkalibacillus uzonensis TaxID=353224 RepID=A0ABU0CPC2_9BACI|nr:methionine ABC transporter ATP-binding protein [Caldalkalibacillus uzonensis]MDQ0338255.1 D-methionine transport system ATP-binding protein [Caldalkalibacillus uzonensis]